nr:MAG TPA: hypothetical protein [Caudoviricetes sp.]
MGKCLVTKLNGTVDNDNLLRIGEIRLFNTKLSNPTANSQYMVLTFSKDANLEIVGDAYFTDTNLSTNKGKTKSCLANQNSAFYVSNNDCQIAILDKYSLIKVETNAHRVGDLEDLRFSKGLSAIIMKKSEQMGDIANLKNLTALTNLDLSGTQISGDIANLKNLTALTNLNLGGTQISGDIANLKNLTALTTLSLSNKKTPLTGDIGELRTLTKCTEIYLSNGKFTGDLATLPSVCRYVSFEYDKGSVLTWGTRPSSAKIIAIAANTILTNIDKMLQDQAQCQVGFTESDQPWKKRILIGGTRTSASDDAVSTLQQKGYTVSITPA